MIGSLRGRVIDIHASFCLLEAGGVGYSVKAAPHTLSALKTGQDVFLHIHDVVREDARELYGFLSRPELELFERLLSVSGVGPKVALTVMSAGTPDALKRAILQGDLAFLTSVPGVGTKTAQKIILDLKGQLVEAGEYAGADGEVIEALVSLGYPAAKAREAVKAVSKDVTDVSERVREALRQLGR